jgi:hypothetical protein
VGPPVVPLSLGEGAADVASWLLNFEVFGYWTHRLLHVQTAAGVRVPIYSIIHHPHHYYKRPTAFCAQVSFHRVGPSCPGFLPRILSAA